MLIHVYLPAPKWILSYPGPRIHWQICLHCLASNVVLTQSSKEPDFFKYFLKSEKILFIIMYFHLENNISLFPNVHVKKKSSFFLLSELFIVNSKVVSLILSNEEDREQIIFKFNQEINVNFIKSSWEPG